MVDDILGTGCNLDRKNPRGQSEVIHLPPSELAAGILKKELRIAEVMQEILDLLRNVDAR